jgi:hypothetical protein
MTFRSKLSTTQKKKKNNKKPRVVPSSGLSFFLFVTTLASLAVVAMTVVVPQRMILSKSLQASLPALYDTPLIPLLFSSSSSSESTTGIAGQLLVQEDTTTSASSETLSSVARSFGTTKNPSICFVVRRPGCVLCREHGQQLHREFASSDASFSTVVLWGIVKETGVDDEGLYEFQKTYYPYPLYKDVDWAIYKAMGNRKIALTTWNPWKLWKGYKALSQRLKEQKIDGNLKGEGMIQGGILLFDAQGILRYAYEEEIGTPLDVTDIRAAYDALVQETATSASAPSSTTTTGATAAQSEL